MISSDTCGGTALHIACCSKSCSSAEVIALLVEKGGSYIVGAKDSWGQSPLHLACKCALQLDKMIHLINGLKGNSSINSKDFYQKSPVTYALENKTGFEVLKMLMDRAGRRGIEAQDSDGHGPLHLACMQKASIEIVQYLVSLNSTDFDNNEEDDDHDEDIECNEVNDSNDEEFEEKDKSIFRPDNDGKRPIHYAFEKGCSADVIRLLLNCPGGKADNIDIFRLDREKKTILHRVCESGTTADVIQLIFDIGQRVRETGDVTDVTKTEDCCLSKPDLYRQEPIHYAIKSKASPDVVDLLLDDRGGNATILMKDYNEDSILHHACLTKGIPFDTVRLLVKRGGIEIIKLENMYGITAIEKGLQGYYFEGICLARKKFAQVVKAREWEAIYDMVINPEKYPKSKEDEEPTKKEKRDLLERNRKAVIQNLRLRSSPSLLKTVINEGGKASLLEKDEGGGTALHIACAIKVDVESIKLLVEVGGSGSIMVGDNWGQTSLHLACHRGCSSEVIRFLLDSMNVNNVILMHDYYRKTPLHYAFADSPASIQLMVLEKVIDNDEEIFDEHDKDEFGRTLLHNACASERISCDALTLLVKIGGVKQLAMKDKVEEMTPLELAMKQDEKKKNDNEKRGFYDFYDKTFIIDQLSPNVEKLTDSITNKNWNLVYDMIVNSHDYQPKSEYYET